MKPNDYSLVIYAVWKKAEEYQCQHIAFPSISTGAYRYPVSQAATIAIETLKNLSMSICQRIDIVCFR